MRAKSTDGVPLLCWVLGYPQPKDVDGKLCQADWPTVNDGRIFRLRKPHAKDCLMGVLWADEDTIEAWKASAALVRKYYTDPAGSDERVWLLDQKVGIWRIYA